MSWLFYSNLDIGTALCDPVCIVWWLALSNCFHVTEVQIMDDNLQRWWQMLWICVRAIILTGKYENTNHVIFHYWWFALMITIDRSWLSVFYWHAYKGHACLWQGYCSPGVAHNCGTVLASRECLQDLLPPVYITESWLLLNTNCVDQQSFLHF